MMCKRLLLISLLLLPGLILPLKGHSGAISSDDQWKGNEVSILIDTTNTITLEDVVAGNYEGAFYEFNDPVFNPGFSEFSYWVKINITDPSSKEQLFEIKQALVRHVDFYYPDSSGWKHVNSGSEVPISLRPVQSHYYLFQLPEGQSICYLHFKSIGTPLPMNIISESDFEQEATAQKITYGIYMGIMFFVIAFNVILFIALQRWAYIHYALLVALYASFSAFMEGYSAYLFPNIDIIQGFIINPILNQPNGLLFCLFFLEAWKFTPKLFRAALVVMVYLVSYIFWHSYLPETTVMQISQIHALLGMFLMAAIGVGAGRRGNKLGYYFALTYFIFFAIATVEVIYLRTGSPPYILQISHVSFAILVEVLLLAWLLAKRFEWERNELQKERLKAQQVALEKTRENERIVREQNIILEEKVKERTYQLSQEKQKSDKLLLNILPLETARELIEHGKAKTRYYDLVTVLFADIKGFTQISEKLPPEKLVKELDLLFGEYDKIMIDHNIEKIKTIGDCYMAVGGLPVSNKTNPMDVVRAATQMIQITEAIKQDKIRNNETYLEVKIGINSGPAVAGVIGTNKFAYDIWGDTVNVASRMEETCEVGRINISEQTFQLVKHTYKCDYRGEIEVKNKGLMSMYFLVESETPVAAGGRM